MSSDGRTVRSTFAAGFIVTALLAGLYLAACSGGGDSSSLRLLTGSGDVQQLRASGWQDIGVLVSLLATQQ